MTKIRTKTALSDKKYPHPIPSLHITTLAVNDTRLTNIVNIRKGERISCDYSQITRLMPLVSPTYGSFKISTASFFVPIRTIWHHYNVFKQQNVDGSVGSSRNPINFAFWDVLNLLFGMVDDYWDFPGPGNTDYVGPATDLGTVSSLSDVLTELHDLVLTYPETSGSGVVFHSYGVNFTTKGRQIWNMFHTLGYTFPTHVVVDEDTEGSYYKAWHSEEYSLLPVLALARVYYDYLYPSNFVNLSGFMYLFSDQLWSRWDYDKLDVWSDILELMINTYDSSFWTSLWQTPNEVVRGAVSNQSVSLSNRLTGSADTETVQSIGGTSSNPFTTANIQKANPSIATSLTANGLRWIEAVSDFAVRNQIGGQRFRDWSRAHFGYVTAEERDESTFIKVFTDEVQIQDVTNVSASNDSAPLGMQGGKGISGGKNRLNFEASEDGFLLFITQVKPIVGYYQGVKPWCRSLTSPRQLYTPEYDGMFMEAVPRSSVFSLYQQGKDYQKVDIGSRSDAFGFAPMYKERYCVPHDYLSGDFILGSRGRNYLTSYHTFRDVLFGRNNLANDLSWHEMDNQTQRVFAYVGTEQEQGYDGDDKMLSFFSFDMIRYSPIKPLSQSIPLFDKSGREVVLDYLGQ